MSASKRTGARKYCRLNSAIGAAQRAIAFNLPTIRFAATHYPIEGRSKDLSSTIVEGVLC